MGNRFSDENPQEILALARAFMQSRMLLTAYELDVFSHLEPKGAKAAVVAEKSGTDVRGMERLLEALAASGIINNEGERFSNTTSSSRFLVSESPDYLAGLMHSVHMYESWSTLTRAVKTGDSVQKGGTVAWDEAKKDAFIAAMHWRARHQAPEVASLLNLGGVKKVLDVGGGSGIFSAAMVRQETGLSATVFDLPDIVPLTDGYVAKEGYSDRIDTVAGNYLSDPLPGGFDLVYLSAIVHSNSPEQNRKLIEKCAGACNPGGRIAVQDFIMEENRMRPVMGALFALNMLVSTEKGDTFTESEISGWMTDAGFGDIRRINSSFGADMILGTKI